MEIPAGIVVSEDKLGALRGLFRWSYLYTIT